MPSATPATPSFGQRLRPFASEIGRRFRQIYRTASRPSSITLDGFTIPIENKWSNNILRSLYSEAYERPEREAIERLVSSEDRVLELGLAIGVVALAIHKAKPAESLHIDANPEMIAASERTMRANDLSFPIRLSAIVPSGFEGETVSITPAEDFWSTRVEELSEEAAARSIEVPAISLSALCNEFSPTVLVIDIEGMECDIFDRDDNLGSVHTIILEIHARKTGCEAQRDMFQRLFDHGFYIDFRNTSGEVVVLQRL